MSRISIVRMPISTGEIVSKLQTIRDRAKDLAYTLGQSDSLLNLEDSEREFIRMAYAPEVKELTNHMRLAMLLDDRDLLTELTSRLEDISNIGKPE